MDIIDITKTSTATDHENINGEVATETTIALSHTLALRAFEKIIGEKVLLLFAYKTGKDQLDVFYYIKDKTEEEKKLERVLMETLKKLHEIYEARISNSL